MYDSLRPRISAATSRPLRLVPTWSVKRFRGVQPKSKNPVFTFLLYTASCRETTTYKANNKQIYFMGARRVTEDPLENLVSSATRQLPSFRPARRHVAAFPPKAAARP